MGKPLGVALGVNADGPTMRVRHPTQTEDKVWEAVETAQAEGWTVDRFRLECAEAWEQARKDQAEYEAQKWRKT